MYGEFTEAAGSLRLTLRTLTWTAVVIGALGLVGCVVGLSTVERLGPLGQNPWADFGVGSLVMGVCVPIALAFTHIGVKAWTGPDGRWHRGRSGLTFRVLASASACLVGAGFGVVGLFPLVLLLPDQGQSWWDAVPVAVGGLLLVGLAVAAVAGGWALAGPLGIPVGMVCGVGIAGAAVGEFFDLGWVQAAGWGLLVLAIAAFERLRGRQP